MEERMEVKDLDHLPEMFQIKTTLPDELPPAVQREKFPAELLRSSTIENLISQNEELMSRLKVTLRRLAHIENENQRLVAETQKEQMKAATASEQLMIFREKDQIWKIKITELEKAKDIIQEKLITLQNMYTISQAQVERHQKYHDRIKNHVKPFVQELKKYSKSLENKIQGMQGEIDKREAQISDLRHQIIEISKNSSIQIENLERSNWQLSEQYENTLHQLTQSNEELKSSNADLTLKVEKANALQERADQFENETVELKRKIQLMTERHEFAMESAHQQIKERSKEYSYLAVEHQDVVQKLLEEIETRKNLEKQVYDLRHQLDSLRYMWNSKNDENEKLRQSLEALEKLNVDLSAKLQDARSALEGSKG
jgi:chromosome segregation ATPase